jgi:hypothetical protein
MWPWISFFSFWQNFILKDASPNTFKWNFIFESWCAMVFWTFVIKSKILNLIQIEFSLINDSKHFAKHIFKVKS